MEGVPIPDWMRNRILEELGESPLIIEALKYIYISEKDGKKTVFEVFDNWENHALMFAVHLCLKKAKDILED